VVVVLVGGEVELFFFFTSICVYCAERIRPEMPSTASTSKKFYATRSVSHWSYTPRAYGKRKHHLRLRREFDATARARVVHSEMQVRAARVVHSEMQVRAARVVHSEMQVRAARVARHGVTRALSLGSHPRTTDLA